jgi:hypothetical protein
LSIFILHYYWHSPAICKILTVLYIHPRRRAKHGTGILKEGGFEKRHKLHCVSKTLFIIPTDVHYYKSVEMLKQFKSYNTCPGMFRFMQEPSSGSSPVLG